MKTKPAERNKYSGIRKLLFALVFSVASFFSLPGLVPELANRLIISWDAFCLTMLLFSWVMFFRTDEKELSGVVASQDDGVEVIFGIVLVATCFSVLGTILLLVDQDEPGGNKILHALLSLSPVILSWLLLHTIFTVRYAHLYHDKNRLQTGSKVGGIEFPAKDQPDYIDFAYFSFVIGMTFQVSDTQVSSRVIRRFVLLHSIVSFTFNTAVVALTINAIAGLMK